MSLPDGDRRVRLLQVAMEEALLLFLHPALSPGIPILQMPGTGAGKCRGVELFGPVVHYYVPPTHIVP